MASPPEKKDITVICTLKNEIGTLDVLMSSLLNQTLKPAEIVVVDGGSTDGTWQRLQDWKGIFAKVGVTMKPLQKRGANISQGRNIAIKNAAGKRIASIDGGCVAESNWLEKLAAQGGDMVSGAYHPLSSNFFERLVSRVVVPDMDALSGDVEPSSRNVMFTKEAWKRVGGYPEGLYTAEDSLFNFRLEKAGYKFRFARDAAVYWRMRASLKSFMKQYFTYGYGDAFASTPLWIFSNPRNKDARGSAWVLVTLYVPAALSLISLPILALPLAVYFTEGLFRAKNVIEAPFTGALMVLKRLSYLAGIHLGGLMRLTRSAKGTN